MTTTQGVRIRALYKAILKLHRGLPQNFKAIGDQYVKDEFKRHKNITTAEAEVFVAEWTKYYLMIGKQLSQRKQKQTIGVNMSPELLDCFSNEQIVQLMELKTETVKPAPDDS
ncbi:succinate dehydrogenase assembly factor 3, mitochondrial-like [Pecten maximus]|uniref:succinate dehydrogenase assembly factor 3, mitochondrial-like n=1 Tax=Pecten maximus TaxID=6579 RepID=UPI00145869FD|nr:succinate dehydrogenase assembly factor 3, mitochondrial-like [Pecten maximus]XP_033732829.1 succinate dehydrogenase assembly factor 3, mitochondrial-like [Pecten maximus]XP_033732830.1 succinate dehydrogenase assembly factor 3, mitochondrial-like [Pecten maximus]